MLILNSNKFSFFFHIKINTNTFALPLLLAKQFTQNAFEVNKIYILIICTWVLAIYQSREWNGNACTCAANE